MDWPRRLKQFAEYRPTRTELWKGPLPAPIDALEQLLQQGGTTIVQAAFQYSFFAHPDAVRRRTPWYPERARLSREHYPGRNRGETALRRQSPITNRWPEAKSTDVIEQRGVSITRTTCSFCRSASWRGGTPSSSAVKGAREPCRRPCPPACERT